jgi:hypothetical protein
MEGEQDQEWKFMSFLKNNYFYLALAFVFALGLLFGRCSCDCGGARPSAASPAASPAAASPSQDDQLAAAELRAATAEAELQKFQADKIEDPRQCSRKNAADRFDPASGEKYNEALAVAKQAIANQKYWWGKEVERAKAIAPFFATVAGSPPIMNATAKVEKWPTAEPIYNERTKKCSLKVGESEETHEEEMLSEQWGWPMYAAHVAELWSDFVGDKNETDLARLFYNEGASAVLDSTSSVMEGAEGLEPKVQVLNALLDSPAFATAPQWAPLLYQAMNAEGKRRSAGVVQAVYTATFRNYLDIDRRTKAADADGAYTPPTDCDFSPAGVYYFDGILYRRWLEREARVPGLGTAFIMQCRAVAQGIALAIGLQLVQPPFLSTLSPPSGSTAGGVLVTITGANLGGATGVSFGGNEATEVTVVSPTQVTCKTPPVDDGGVYQVTVTTPGGISATRPYTYIAAPAPPAEQAAAPAAAPAAAAQ